MLTNSDFREIRQFSEPQHFFYLFSNFYWTAQNFWYRSQKICFINWNHCFYWNFCYIQLVPIIWFYICIQFLLILLNYFQKYWQNFDKRSIFPNYYYNFRLNILFGRAVKINVCFFSNLKHGEVKAVRVRKREKEGDKAVFFWNIM